MRPADAVLSLPAGRHSAHLTCRVVLEAVRGSYDQAKAALDRGCGKVVGKRQAEQLVISASRDIDTFYGQKIPAPATAETVLALQADAKGIRHAPRIPARGHPQGPGHIRCDAVPARAG